MTRMLIRFAIATVALASGLGCSATDQDKSLAEIYPRLWVERDSIRTAETTSQAKADTGRLIVHLCGIPGVYEEPRHFREPTDVGATVEFGMPLSPVAMTDRKWQIQIPERDRVLGVYTDPNGGGYPSAYIQTQQITVTVVDAARSMTFEREPVRELIRAVIDDGESTDHASALRALLAKCNMPYRGELSDEQVFLVLAHTAAQRPNELREIMREAHAHRPESLVEVAADRHMERFFTAEGNPDAVMYRFDAPFFRMYILPRASHRPSQAIAATLYVFRDSEYSHYGGVMIRHPNNDPERLVDVAAYLFSDMLTGYGRDF